VKLDADVGDVHAHLELLAEEGRRTIIAFRACQDDARTRARTPAGDLPPEREAALLQIREVDGVVDVAHRIAVAKADFDAMAEREDGWHEG